MHKEDNGNRRKNKSSSSNNHNRSQHTWLDHKDGEVFYPVRMEGRLPSSMDRRQPRNLLPRRQRTLKGSSHANIVPRTTYMQNISRGIF